MVLSDLNLTNFRNYSRRNFHFLPGVNFIYGPNASGKSNLLEAVYLLASGASWRAGKTPEMIKAGESFGKIEAGCFTEVAGSPLKLEVVLEKESVFGGDGRETAAGKKRHIKKYKVNGVPRRRRDFSGLLRAVLFSPEQLNLVSGEPSYRRYYLDLLLSQSGSDYAQAISDYNKARYQRNNLLYQIKEGSNSISELDYWNGLLTENSLVVNEGREKYIKMANSCLIEDRKRLWEDGWYLQLDYRQSPLNRERLFQYREKEIRAGRTLIGPHREDFLFLKVRIDTDRRETPMRTDTEGVDLHRYGSRGEQRLAVFALKLAEWEFLAKEGNRPLLLLDDIFSELDGRHRQIILSNLEAPQILITTAEEKQFREAETLNWNKIDLSA